MRNSLLMNLTSHKPVTSHLGSSKPFKRAQSATHHKKRNSAVMKHVRPSSGSGALTNMAKMLNNSTNQPRFKATALAKINVSSEKEFQTI